METEGKNPSRVAAGLKAAVHNPRVSDEAKESAAERLHQMGAEQEVAGEATNQESRTQETGSKSPPHTSPRRHSAANEAVGAHGMEGKSENRVMGGYKAALKNPRVSEEAKEHAEEVLEQHHVRY